MVNAVPSAGISEDTRARVLRAIAQLDYHPHEGARSLGRQATRSIGVAIPDTSNPHYLEITAGIADYAAQEGYSVMLATTNFAIQRERQCLMWLKERRSDALIASFVHGPDLLEEMRTLRRSGYPVTLLGVVDDEIDSSNPHGREGERLLLDHLYSLGHRAIGYIYGVYNQQVYGERPGSVSMSRSPPRARRRGLQVNPCPGRGTGPTPCRSISGCSWARRSHLAQPAREPARV